MLLRNDSRRKYSHTYSYPEYRLSVCQRAKSLCSTAGKNYWKTAVIKQINHLLITNCFRSIRIYLCCSQHSEYRVELLKYPPRSKLLRLDNCAATETSIPHLWFHSDSFVSPFRYKYMRINSKSTKGLLLPLALFDAFKGEQCSIPSIKLYMNLVMLVKTANQLLKHF